MFFYQCQLAWRSIKKNPILCGLMILSLASGIAAAMVCYTQQYAVTRNPLMHKDDTLFILQTDSWDLKAAYHGQPLNDMPDTMSYRDVTALMRSDIPIRKTAMVHTGGVVSVPGSDAKPFLAASRISTRDYFAMFEETFVLGDVWSKAADDSFQNVVALSEDTNKRLFQGQNSIGKTILFEGKLYQVIAIVKQQSGQKNKIQDVERGVNGGDTQLYFPFGLLTDHEITIWAGAYECPEDLHDYGTGFQVHLKDACSWLTYWVEFDKTSKKQDYEEFIKQYILDQKTQGFYPRPLRFALSNATQKLVIDRYDSGFYALLVKLGFGFLLVCTINCIAMLLAKFLKHAPESGVRRALGASRTAIFYQHLLESAFIGILGGLLGLVFTYVGLALLRHGFAAIPQPSGVSQQHSDSIFVPDTHILILTIVLAVAASLCAGLYPAWRICRTPAAQYLKLQ